MEESAGIPGSASSSLFFTVRFPGLMFLCQNLKPLLLSGFLSKCSADLTFAGSRYLDVCYNRYSKKEGKRPRQEHRSSGWTDVLLDVKNSLYKHK